MGFREADNVACAEWVEGWIRKGVGWEGDGGGASGRTGDEGCR